MIHAFLLKVFCYSFGTLDIQLQDAVVYVSDTIYNVAVVTCFDAVCIYTITDIHV